MYGIRVRKTSLDPWQRVRTKTHPKGLWSMRFTAEAVLARLRLQGWRGHTLITDAPAPPPPALSVRKPGISYDGRAAGHTHGDQTPRRIILHDTESHDTAGLGDVVAVLGYLSRTQDKLNAHLVVDAEGYTGLGADFTKKTYHCKGANTDSVGLEMIGFAHFSLLQWTARREQLEVVARWLAWLSKEYGIPLVHDVEHGVARHRDVPEGGHSDPGALFPFTKVLARAQELRRTGW